MASKEELLKITGKAYTYPILESLKERKRCVELADACPGEKTRTQRIKELHKTGLIEHALITKGPKVIVRYKLTAEGERILKILRKI